MDNRIETLTMEQTQRGFNQGYLLAQHKPELYQTILKSIKKNGENPYLKGFESGGKQYEKDKSKEKLKAQTPSKQPQKQPAKSTPKPPTRGR